MMAGIHVDSAAIRQFCERNGIRRFALFGSVIRDDFRGDSDVDALVEFVPGQRTGLAFLRMERELSSLLGRKVDLNTPGFLGASFRDDVLREAEVIYSADR